jgi:hypothetical protein
MASNVTDIKIYDGIEVRAQKPMDVRSIVTYREDLYKLETWPHDSYVDENGDVHHIIYMKEGMQVTVTGDKTNPIFEVYILTDLNKILEKDYSGWKLHTGSGSPTGPGAFIGNIDGGRADERYTASQVIFCGNATSRGEHDDE